MGARRLGRLCRSILPPDFERIKRQLPDIQSFLERDLPAPLNRAVTLLTLTRSEVVIAANSPLVANYLRLHGAELRQRLRETFDLELSLKIRTLPDSMLRLDPPAPLRLPAQVSPGAIDALRRNAQWIEDEGLRAAMLSLAESLETD